MPEAGKFILEMRSILALKGEKREFKNGGNPSQWFPFHRDTYMTSVAYALNLVVLDKESISGRMLMCDG